MARISEIGTQSPLAGLLKEGLTFLSGDQHVTFRLYRKFVNPVDGLVYWVKVLPGSESADIRLTAGLAHETGWGGESVQAVDGGVAAQDIVSGRIANPATADGQGQASKMFPLYVSFTGPADHVVSETTSELWPGNEITVPPQPQFGAWVTSEASGHKFSVVLMRAISSLSGQPLTIEQGGSLHYMSQTEQEEDAVLDTNTVVFTSKDEIRAFNEIGPDELYIGERDAIRFAFKEKGFYYEAADIWHYQGQALYSVNKPLVIDDPVGWEPEVFVTNSLPIWLSMAGYVPPYPGGFMCPFPVYPAYLAPDNTQLPFASIHVQETEGLQPLPWLGRRMQHGQLVKDIVRVTLYGASARASADFMDFVLQYSLDDASIGILGSPVVLRDEHRTQPEFLVLAQKKVIEFEISYQQAVARDLARQVIKRALVQFYDALGHGPL